MASTAVKSRRACAKGVEAVWAMTGKYLPVIHVGRAVRYRQSDLEKFIEKQTVPAC